MMCWGLLNTGSNFLDWAQALDSPFNNLIPITCHEFNELNELSEVDQLTH